MNPLMSLRKTIIAILIMIAAANISHAKDADNTVILYLQPGYHGPDKNFSNLRIMGGEEKSRPPIPPGEIQITLPLYPGAVPTNLSRGDIGGIQLSLYLKSAMAVYVVPTDPSSVIEWYRKAFMAAGYSAREQRSIDSTEGSKRSIVQFFNFASQNNQANKLTVQLAVEPDSKGHTVATYFATAIVLPVRHTKSHIKSTVKWIDVKRHTDSWTSGPRPLTTIFKITKPEDIAAVVTAFNNLSIDDRRGPLHGTLQTHHWDIAFRYANGSTLTAYIDPAHRVVYTENDNLTNCCQLDDLLTKLTMSKSKSMSTTH